MKLKLRPTENFHRSMCLNSKVHLDYKNFHYAQYVYYMLAKQYPMVQYTCTYYIAILLLLFYNFHPFYFYTHL